MTLATAEDQRRSIDAWSPQRGAYAWVTFGTMDYLCKIEKLGPKQATVSLPPFFVDCVNVTPGELREVKS